MDIAIFGAGIAGLTTAVTLQAQGHRCRIYERRSQTLDAGMDFILMPADIERLQSLDLPLRSALCGMPLRQYLHRNAEGRILHEQSMPAGARGIRRRDLIAELRNLLPDDVLTCNAKLEDLAFDSLGHVRMAHLDSGACIRADLFVAADGSHSRARRSLFPEWPMPLAQVQEIIGFAECADTTEWTRHNLNKFHADGGGLSFGILPLSRNYLAWYMQFDTKRFSPPLETIESKQAFVHRLVGRWAAPIPHLLAVTDFSKVHVWRPLNADLVPRFHQGNLVLVGDAAHPFSPFTSQGVSSAIADAAALTQALTGESSLAKALPRYTNERRGKCQCYVEKGRELSRHFLAPQVEEEHLLPLTQ